MLTKPVEKRCVICGKLFVTTVNNKSTYSKECRKEQMRIHNSKHNREKTLVRKKKKN